MIVDYNGLCHTAMCNVSTGFPSSLDVAFAEVSSIDGRGMKELKHKLKELVDK